LPPTKENQCGLGVPRASRACEDQSLRDWKKVRAMVSNSSLESEQK